MKTMKIKCLLASLFLLINATFVEAQQTLVRGDTIILDAPPPPHWLNANLIYRASDLIQLDPDFSAKPGEDGSVFLENDPLMVYYDYLYVRGGSSENNMGGNVGNLQGNLDVTPSGAAQYNSPLILPAGINGLTPDLSFVYNSQAGDGIMGLGWSIGGLSKISRTPYTYSISNFTHAVQFNDVDQLFYNGNFLIKDSNGIFYSEVHDFTRIEPLNSASIDFGFKVQMPNGLIYEYGTSEGSRYYLQTLNKPIEWHIEKIIDPYGNYIKFEYVNDKDNGSFHPVRILYTGNDLLNIDPSYEIQFVYAQDEIPWERDEPGPSDPLPFRTDTQRKYFSADEHGTGSINAFFSHITHQIKSIRVMYIPDDFKLIEYQLSYQNIGELPKLCLEYIIVAFWGGHVLGEIKENDTEKSSNIFNPMKFEWTDNQYNIDIIDPYTLPFMFSGEDLLQEHFFTINLSNQKDISDLVHIKKDNSNNWLIHIYVNNSTVNSNGDFNFSFGPIPKYKYITDKIPYYFGAGDLDGDGTDELIMVYRVGYQLYAAIYSGYDFSEQTVQLGAIDPNEKLRFALSDFTGNGLSDLVVIREENSGSIRFYLTEDTSDPFNDFVHFATNLTSIKEMLIGDFNGDKRSELLVIQLGQVINKSTLFKLSASNNVVVPSTPNIGFHNLQLNYNYRMLTGDFNGDGKSDILFIRDGANDNWQFFLSSGSGIFIENTTAINELEINDVDEEIHVPLGEKIAIDINGDGFTDIAHIYWEDEYNEDINDYVRVYYRRDFLLRADYQYKEKINYIKHSLLDEDGYRIHLDEIRKNTGTQHWMPFHNAIGNFTGFSGTQILSGRTFFVQLGQYKLKATLTGPLYEKHNQLVSSILNGFGFTKKIEYTPSTYQKPYNANKNIDGDNKSSYGYPISKFRSSINVVESISSETTEGNFLDCQYRYGDASYHKLGKGFLGFDIIEKWDKLSNTYTKENFKILSPIYHVVMSARSVSIIDSNIPYESTTFDYTLKKPFETGVDNEIYFSFLNMKKTWHFVNEANGYNFEKITEVAYTDPDDYGNPQTIVQQYKNLQQQVKGSITNNILYENITTGDRRVIGLPKTIETVHQLADGPAIVRNVENDYNLTTGFLETRIHEPGSLKQLTETFVPDNFGNLQSHTQSAAGLPDRTTTTQYTPDGRFPHIITNAEGHSQVHEYYPVSGLLKSVTDENELTTQYIYNPYRQLLYTIHPDGAQQGNKYGWVRSFGVPDPPQGTPEHGDPIYFIRSRKAGSPENIVFYDQHSRPVREIKQGFDNQWIFTDYTYYAQPGLNGLLNQKSNPFFASAGEAQNWITFNYDYRQRLIKTTMPDNSFESITYKANQKDASLFDGTTKSINYHETGLMHKVSDNDATEVDFIYYPDGKLKESKVAEDAGTVIAYTYDVHGRQQTVDDPSLGLIEYDYDAFGDLRTETDSRSTTTYEYDRLGRLTDRNGSDGTTTWLWDTQQNGVGKLHSIAYAAIDSPVLQMEELFTYNETGFVETHTQTLNNEPKTFNYAYDALSRLKQITWPTGFQTINYYDATGFLRHISDAQANKLWQAVGHDKWEKISQFKLGGALAVQYDFDGLNANVRSIRTKNDQGLLQRLSYIWDNATGNLESRTDHVRNLTESFDYDGFNRLTHITFGGNTNEWASYNTLGNITQKLDAGQYTAYKPTNPYAVETIVPAQSAFPPDEQIVDYTFFNKVSTILEGVHTLQIGYGPARERVWQQQANLQSGILQTKRYFTNLYETVNDAAGQEKHLHYLIAPTGVFAIFTAMNDGSSHIQYLLKDHQGSLAEVAGSDGQVTESYSFDAFGRRRNAQTWTLDNLPTSFGIDRGYTFHEHLDAFELINMNGRMYDPLVARFLSPDPFIQNPEYSQSYNRYSYVFNNPLRFVDPSGYFAEGDSTAGSDRPIPRLLFQEEEKPIPYRTDTKIALEGPDENSFVVGGINASQGRAESVTVTGVLFELAADLISESLQYVGMDARLADNTGTISVLAGSLIFGRPNTKQLTRGMVPNSGGKIVSFTTRESSVYFRVYSNNPYGGAFLTKVPPKSSIFAREGLALPSSNTASYIQSVTVPSRVTLQRSRALGAFGRRGGLEQFQILNFDSRIIFHPGIPLR